ncbi:MAG: DUF6350 family protein [Mycobacteriales bacterium]
MTETLNRPAPTSLRSSPTRSGVGAGAAAALWTTAVGLLCVVVPALLVWGTDSRSGAGAGEALRNAARLWLVAHGASLDVPGGRYALTPIGLLLLPLALLARFAAVAARDVRPARVRAAMTLTLWIAGPYALLVAAVAVAATDPDVYVSPVQSLLAGLAVGLAGAAFGVLCPGRLWRAAWHALSRRTRRLVQAAAAAAALSIAAGAVLAGGSLAFHGARAAELAGSSEPGVVGGIALLLACLALLPNAVVWAVAWLAGPGFAVGVGTVVSPSAHEVGPVPALPLLAALPDTAVPGWVGVAGLVVPLVAGAVAGRMVIAELAADEPGRVRTVTEAALVGPVCGAAVWLLAWLSGGAVGGARLVQVGPSPWRVALAVATVVAVGSVAGALLRRGRLLGRS